MASPVAPHTSSPAELKERLEAERGGKPFLIYRDGDGHQRICVLGSSRDVVTVGRRGESDIALDWDPEVSRLHAIVDHVGGNWTIADEALSSNGSFVNGERLVGRRRLADRDTILVGNTAILFRDPGAERELSTVRAGSAPARSDLSPAQLRVLVALCRPYRHDATYAVPASNRAIADELVVSVEAVKSHLRALFEKFGVKDLPQNEKRARLVAAALRTGLVSERDFY